MGTPHGAREEVKGVRDKIMDRVGRRKCDRLQRRRRRRSGEMQRNKDKYVEGRRWDGKS